VPVTRSDVVHAAVELIDADGLDALTLRALATRLGISAPTLYWHVRDKRHLLDLVAEHLAEEFLPPGGDVPLPGEAVDAWLGRVARAQRRALLAHRDSARVVAGNRPTLEALPQIERSLAALVAGGLAPGEALRTLTALGSYVVGDVLETQLGADREPPEGMREALLSGAHPTLLAAGRAMGADEDRFEHGLDLLLVGLRARLAAPAPRTPAPAPADAGESVGAAT
jgi:TetR/AcrR family transcriptional regulator, tetracycline repressor protein